jgi:uncharacterized protein YoxC
MFLEISVVVLSIVFLLLAAVSIPFLLQIWKTAKGIAATLHMLNQNLPGILKNLEEITANINKATYTVNTQVEGLSLAVKHVQDTISSIALEMEGLIRADIGIPVFKSLRNIVAVIKGVRVFLNVYRSPHKSQ